MMRTILKMYRWFENRLALLAFTRFIECFLVFAIPGFLSVWVLQRKVINNLMYALFAASMALAIAASVILWVQFMGVIRSKKKYMIINFGSQLAFAIVSTVWFMIITEKATAVDTLLYTRMFAGLRCLEFFGLKTIVSVGCMNALLVVLCPIVGKITYSNVKRDEADVKKMESDDAVDAKLAKIILTDQRRRQGHLE